MVKATGHVVIRFGTRTIKADKVIINSKSGAGVATGHVRILDEGSDLKAEKIKFNAKSKQGQIYNAQGKVGKQYRVKGRKVTRLSETHYKAVDSHLTTCSGPVPDWSIQTDWLDLKTGNRALFKRGLFKIKNVTVAYLPVGYVPLDNTRKSGFLFPGFGNSNQDGFIFSPAYYWAINRTSDATVFMDIMTKRGVRPEVEYRYTPSTKTTGQFFGSILNDQVTDSTFYKVLWTHDQLLPNGYDLSGKLDLVGDNNFDKTFTDDTALRTRRSTDSFLTVSKSWTNNSLDVTTRFRDSTEDDRDDTLAKLPQVVFKTQKHKLAKSGIYFNQDSSFVGFLTDLDPTIENDDDIFIGRLDFHPQLSTTWKPAAWLSVTPTVGARETVYTEGLENTDERTGALTRELFDFQTVLEGPKFKKIYHTNNRLRPKFKHIIEPRFTYDFIPDMDQEDRDKIKVFDSVDSVAARNTFKYSLTQRLFSKDVKGDDSESNQIMRFEVSQTYDIREQTRDDVTNRMPFSDIRFDFDSRPFDPLMINFDTTYDVNDNSLDTFNFEFGIKPLKNLSLYFERRFTADVSTFILGTFDLELSRGWRLIYSTRFDEELAKFQENDLSVRYDNKCKCWGFGFDFINRNNINSGINQKETKFLFTLELRGLGSIGTENRENLLHRDYKGFSIF